MHIMIMYIEETIYVKELISAPVRSSLVSSSVT